MERETFMKYCERAFERFFNNDEKMMSVSELYEILCKDNSSKKEFIEAILEEFDEDQSDTISFSELIHVFLKNLSEELPKITYEDVRK